MSSKPMFIASLVSATFLLSACGGSGSSDSDTIVSEPESDETGLLDFVDPGIFVTTVDFTDGPSGQEALTALSPTGRLTVLFAPDDVTTSDITLDEDGRFSDPAADILFDSDSDEWVQIDGVIKGEAVNRQTIEGTAEELSGDIASSFTMDRDNVLSDAGASIDLINRTFVDGDTQITIDADGDVTGSAPTSCQMLGTVTVPNEQFNIYEVAIKVSNCDSGSDLRNDTYTGLAYFEQDAGEFDVVMTNGEIVGTFFFGPS